MLGAWNGGLGLGFWLKAGARLGLDQFNISVPFLPVLLLPKIIIITVHNSTIIMPVDVIVYTLWLVS